MNVPFRRKSFLIILGPNNNGRGGQMEGADDTYTRTFRRALELAGSEAALAEALGTSPEIVGRWLAGELRPPLKMCFGALSLVAPQNQRRK